MVTPALIIITTHVNSNTCKLQKEENTDTDKPHSLHNAEHTRTTNVANGRVCSCALQVRCQTLLAEPALLRLLSDLRLEVRCARPAGGRPES